MLSTRRCDYCMVLSLCFLFCVLFKSLYKSPFIVATLRCRYSPSLPSITCARIFLTLSKRDEEGYFNVKKRRKDTFTLIFRWMIWFCSGYHWHCTSREQNNSVYSFFYESATSLFSKCFKYLFRNSNFILNPFVSNLISLPKSHGTSRVICPIFRKCVE